MYDDDQLAALAAVVAEGSFDAAAARLHVTPSAVSQRVKALEQHVGRVLVRRSRPCVATDEGQVLVRLAGQRALLDADARRALHEDEPDERRRRLAVAVNADSLCTWFPRVLAGLPADVVVDLRREDQDLSARLLRDGTVMAAVTADATAVQGCRVHALGAMRYLAVTSPDAHARWFAGRPLGDALAAAPTVAFDRQDALQHRFVRAVAGTAPAGVVHFAPEQTAFVALARAGLAWGMVPEEAARDELASGALVEVAPGRHLDVPLYWQHWALRTATLDDLTERVRTAARAALRGAGRAGEPAA